MAKKTGISWCDSTANLWIGCQWASRACDNCYAEDMMGGLGEEPQPGDGRRFRRVEWGRQGERSYCKQGWADLMRWQRAAETNGGVDPELGRPRVVFINSLSDFLDNHPSVIWRPEAWALFRRCTHLILIIVTKRPQLIARELPEFWNEIAGRVRLVTTAEDQATADWRIPALLKSTTGQKPAGVYGVSFEPLLGEIKLDPAWLPCPKCRGRGSYLARFADNYPTPCETCISAAQARGITIRHGQIAVSGPRLGWGIIGGESGRNARSMPADEGLGLIEQLREHRVAVHYKQRSEADHPKTFDSFDTFPRQLRIREEIAA